LQVSQIVWETSSIALCAGKFLVCTYCMMPKAIPIKQMINPALRMVNPARAPPINETWVKSGTLMSASPAKAAPAASRIIKVLSKNVQILVLFLNINYSSFFKIFIFFVWYLLIAFCRPFNTISALASAAHWSNSGNTSCSSFRKGSNT